eukprot:TRINITY_DN21678_c0_g1_i1.p1 TRINITY_DN21678_c0_g1~~TRINITY_DN21678_c0_g1_i1.p1  ORF type:complete len:623 (-),score=160.24 TRINITY_DN21678_c0_g1_i1:471-2339(-)
MAAPFDPTDLGGGPTDDPLGLDLGLEAEAEEDEAGGDVKQLRDAILFVIDCASKGALDPISHNGKSVVEEALSAAVSILKTKVITSPDDKVAVMLYGVADKLNPNGLEGIRMLQDLDRSDAKRIRELENEMKRTPAQFAERYGTGREVQLSDVLWTCSSVFSAKTDKKHYQARVFLFTANDWPCRSLGELDVAQTKAQDLLDNGVDVEFFPIKPKEGEFSMAKFWGRILPVDEADYLEQAAVRVDELERRVRRRLHRKRILQRLNWQICPGVEVAISVFVHVLQAKVPAPTYLLKENNKPLKSETRNICEQTGKILHPIDDVETYVELGGGKVPVSRSEMDECKRLGETGMQLIGFQSRDLLRAHHRIFHSYFVYPNDRSVSGSAAFCGALLESLIARRQLALVRYRARKASMPVIAALVPQAEQVDEASGCQVTPPGFHMVILPWKEEIRELRFPVPEGAPPPSAELGTAARRVVTAMRLEGFGPGCVENPVLQKHYAAVQALALQEEKPEDTPDLLKPDQGALDEKAPLIQAWKAAVDTVVPAWMAGAGKRAAGDGEERAPKVPKVAIPAPTTLEGMRELVHNGEVARLTVPVLRDWLKGQGMATGGNKADLLDRVKAIV